MTDPKKLVKNTLFNPSVTGSTYEEVSQHAVLFPAMEKPPQPVLNITTDQILQNDFPSVAQYESPAVLTPVESFTTHPQTSSNPFLQPAPQGINLDIPQQTLQSSSQQSGSNLTSVLSSFSNYLKLGSGSNRPKDNNNSEAFSAPVPALLDSYINQDNAVDPPVPLFDPTAPLVQPSQELIPPSVTSGSINTFRRTGLKRPTYAPVPGLSGGTNSHQPLPTTNITNNYFPPAVAPTAVSSIFPPPVPQPSLSPASSTSSIQDVTFALNSQFKPINPQPPSSPSVKPNIPLPQHSTHSFNLGPVMDAIPASEALPQSQIESDINSRLAANNANKTYRPVYHHWFYKKGADDKNSWTPFSMVDSLALEQGFMSNDLDPDKVIGTDGGRYDVNILRRQKTPVYWKGTVSEVRRCSWFYKNDVDRHYVPYEENVAATLEDEFKIAFELNQWHRKVQLANGETVEFHAPDVLVLFPPQPTTDSTAQTQVKPRLVKRGMDEFDIDDGESTKVDHVLFMVHGIGKFCDLRFRTVEEAVDEFRDIALQLTQAHYKSSCEQGVINRVEVLPISWHGKLHSDETGVDEQLKKITLPSIPKLREFTNDTILDVLFYTSPMYCQTIISTVGDELNRVYNLFKDRNPSFQGGVSIGGHSLGSLIIFDLLAHQHSEDSPEDTTEEVNPKEDASGSNKTLCRRISYMMGTVDAAQPKISYPHLNFKPHTFFALGSPIGMFVTVRGLAKLGENFCLPTCPSFFNIFHPYDPVAYRIEALINPELAKLKPVLIAHHKGRKRMHLELKETMARVGADLKQKVVESMKSKWNPFYQLALFQRSEEPVIEQKANENSPAQLETTPEEAEALELDPQPEITDFNLGQLNNGRRIDYVLQEAPLEIVNDYFFAISSHVCYWRSEDSILMILKEIYSSLKVETDNKIPQQTMTIVRPPPSPNSQRQGMATGMNPTSPISTKENLPPPPTTGFMRKT